MQIELDREEGNALGNLIDIAVRARGVEVAEVALHFIRKIRAAAAKDDPHPLQGGQSSEPSPQSEPPMPLP